MERYNEYKDSGVQWIGEIPSHWEMKRLKTILRVKDKRNLNPDALLLSVYTAIGVRPRHELEERGNKASTVINYKIVNKGDLIVNRLLAWMGAYGLSNYEGVTSPDYDVYSFHGDVNKEYYETFFRHTQFKSDCYKYGHGIMMMRWRTYSDEFLSINVPIPPKEEQDAIYNYLKPQVEKIDAAISQQQKMIDLLNERKQIIINNAVTKGLNPNVKMKDSGVEWIGEICNNWRIYRLKHLLKTNLMYGANESAESEENSFPRYIRITDIDENGKLKPDTFRSLEPQKAEPYLLTKGDILFARSGATAGKTYLFDEDIKACFAGYLIKAQVSNGLLPQYLMYFTRSGIYDQWRNSIFIQATIQNIGADKYANLRIPLPSIEEQKAIVNYLNKESEKIDNVLYAHNKQISLLQERKQIIINDVVTGKVKVK